jgi:hypothetical protein
VNFTPAGSEQPLELAFATLRENIPADKVTKSKTNESVEKMNESLLFSFAQKNDANIIAPSK